jgi:hypothetical protein|tara:strand:+ start:146 stop:643 length:498 start_codon:yes stop_codon:yes gene_type:complete
MKNLFFLTVLFFSLASCTNVSFVSPQPEFLEPLSEIPEKFRGSFFLNDKPKDVSVVTNNTIEGVSIDSDSLIVKARGNYLYVNILSERNNYELYIFKAVFYLNYEKIYVICPNIEKEKLHLFNVIDEFEDFFTKQSFLLNNVNVNQFNLLVNSASNEKSEFKRLR